MADMVSGRGVNCGVRYLTPGRGGHMDGPGVVGTCLLVTIFNIYNLGLYNATHTSTASGATDKICTKCLQHGVSTRL